MSPRKMSHLMRGSNTRQIAEHTYVGPLRFKGICDNCGDARNRHCGRCHACVGYHVAGCLQGHNLGATNQS